MNSHRIRIAIIDDHAVVREGLKMLLSTHAGFEMAGEASSAGDALDLLRRAQPDVALLDLMLGSARGEDLISEMHAAAPDCAILVLTGAREAERHKLAVLRGARGVVAKESAADVLIKAVHKVHSGELWLERAQMGTLLSEALEGNKRQDAEAQRIASLTGREREIIALVGQGLRNEEIGARLSLREKTIRNHLTSVYEKLGVKDRLELAIYAHRRRLASFDVDPSPAAPAGETPRG